MQPLASPPRTVPAWLMSVALHAAALIAGLWLFSATPEPKPLVSKVRRAEIILVPAQSTPTPAAWLEDKEGRYSSQTLRQTSHAEPPESAGVESAAKSLPGSDAAPALPGIALPEFAVSPAGAGQWVAPPGNLGGRGRPKLLPGIDEAAILAEEAARPRPAPPRGTPARLSLFGVPAVGRSFVFVIDRSESMGGSRLGAIDAAADALSESIEALDAEQFFQVVAYNEAASIYARRELMPASAENQRELVAFVRKLSAFGGTEHTYGLQAALKLRPEVIYLLTDGGDPAPNSLQLRTVRELAGEQTQIHCLHFGRGERPATGDDFLPTIAKENRGAYTYINLDRR